MTTLRFKVGDRVRVARPKGNWARKYEGREGSVTQVDSWPEIVIATPYCVDDLPCSFADSELEAVTEDE